MTIIDLSILFSSLLYSIGLISIIFNLREVGSTMWIKLLISLELLFLGLSLMFIILSFILDDIIGINMTIFLLPIIGSETALLLTLLLSVYPTIRFQSMISSNEL